MAKNQGTTAAKLIGNHISFTPEIGLILGSGLGMLADEIENAESINYHEIPGFPLSTVEGHAGQFVFGSLKGKKVAAMKGRFHYYEGYSLEKVTFPIQVMHSLGIQTLIVTNAAGGVNPFYQPGDLMLIKDHINNMGNYPLIVQQSELFSFRSFDMSSVYSTSLIAVAEKAAANLGITIQKGVYVANSGPTYETPAEVRMIRKMGGDAVGMSTVPEVIAAKRVGMEVLAISCITNMAAGMLNRPLNHQEVIETTEKTKENFVSLVKTIIQNL